MASEDMRFVQGATDLCADVNATATATATVGANAAANVFETVRALVDGAAEHPAVKAVYDYAGAVAQSETVAAAVDTIQTTCAAVNADYPHVVGALAVLATLFILRRATAPRRVKNAPLRTRSTSIGTTKLMLKGGLPDANYDCVINCRVGFAEGLPTLEELKHVIARKIAPYTQFRSVPVMLNSAAEFTWAPVALDLDNHLWEEEVAGGNMAERIDELANTRIGAMEKGHPWWEMVLLRDEGAMSGVLLIRIQHVIGDGVSLMQTFAGALKDEHGKPLDLAALFNPSRFAPPTGILAVAKRVACLPLTALDAVSCGISVIAAAFVGRDTPSVFNCKARQMPLQRNRFAVYLPSHSLALVKDIRAKAKEHPSMGGAHITVNDIEFALIAGAVRRWMQAEGEDPDRAMLRAMTPLAVPEAEDPVTKYSTTLRNYWTFIMNRLPVEKKSAVDRLAAAHNSWQRLKTSMMVPVSFLIHKATAALLPWKDQLETSAQLQTRMSIVFSNVPGPAQPVYFAGKQITSTHMVFPNLSQQVGILSTNGWVHGALTLASDKPKGEVRTAFVKAFEDELRGMCLEFGIPESRLDAGLTITAGERPARATPPTSDLGQDKPRLRKREPSSNVLKAPQAP